jgi:hypothetical protein
MKSPLGSLLSGFFLLAATCSSAYAFPNLGANCASCHTRSDGAFDFAPSNLLELQSGEMGQITFNVTDIATGTEAAVGVVGLDAAGLTATPDLTGWTQQAGWLTSDQFSAVGPVLLKLTLGASAALGNYPINVTLAGGSGTEGARWSTMQSFTIRVVPEPTTFILLGAAGVSVAIAAKQRLSYRNVMRRWAGRCNIK